MTHVRTTTSTTFQPTRQELKLLEKARQSTSDIDEEGSRLLARVVWSRISEPGDRVAGSMLRTLGPERALHSLLDRADPAHTTREVRNADTSMELTPPEVRTAFDRWLPRLDRAAIEQDLRNAVRVGARLLVPEDEHWPERLNDLREHAPHALWVRGDTSLLRTEGIAIVGARASTPYGEQVTTEFADAATRWGFTVISGAAYGIDAVAHRTALAAGGKTVAVLAGGIDRNYPLAHDALIERIAQEGAVCSEVVPGTPPTRWRFLQRNRVISALATTTLVTEAGLRSGSLNTAGHAAQLGRRLGAVPGPITSVGSMGCFKLIQEYDATMVTTETDLEVLLGTDTLIRFEPDTEGREPALHMRVRDALPLRGAIGTEDIAKLAGVSATEARTALIELEVLGRVQLHGEGWDVERWSLR